MRSLRYCHDVRPSVCLSVRLGRACIVITRWLTVLDKNEDGDELYVQITSSVIHTLVSADIYHAYSDFVFK